MSQISRFDLELVRRARAGENIVDVPTPSPMSGSAALTPEQIAVMDNQRSTPNQAPEWVRALAGKVRLASQVATPVISAMDQVQNPQAYGSGGWDAVPSQIGRGVARGGVGMMQDIYEGVPRFGAAVADRITGGPNAITDSVRELASIPGNIGDVMAAPYGQSPDVSFFSPAGMAGGIAETGTQLAGQVGAGVLTGGASVPAQVGAFAAVAGGQAVGGQQRSIEDDLLSRGYGRDDAARLASNEASVSGLVVAISERVPGFAILRRISPDRAIGVASRIAREAGQIGVAGAAELTQETTQELAEAAAQVFNRGDMRYEDMSADELASYFGELAIQSFAGGAGARGAVGAGRFAGDVGLMAADEYSRYRDAQAFGEQAPYRAAEQFDIRLAGGINIGQESPIERTYEQPEGAFQRTVDATEQARETQQRFPGIRLSVSGNAQSDEAEARRVARSSELSSVREQRDARLAEIQGRVNTRRQLDELREVRLADRARLRDEADARRTAVGDRIARGRNAVEAQVSAAIPPTPDREIAGRAIYSDRAAAEARARFINERPVGEPGSPAVSASIQPIELLGETVGFEVVGSPVLTAADRSREAGAEEPSQQPGYETPGGVRVRPAVALGDDVGNPPIPNRGEPTGDEPGRSSVPVDGDAGSRGPTQQDAASAPTTRKPNRRQALSKTGIERRLVERTDELFDIDTQLETLAATGGSVDLLPTSFAGPVPTEITEALEGRDIRLRRVFRGNDPDGKAQDVMSAMGVDRYLELVEQDAMRSSPTGRVSQALERAKQSGDPELEFLAWMHENLPQKQADRPKWKARRVGTLEGQVFEINGQEFAVTEDDGQLVLTGANQMTYLGSDMDIPVDVGTERAMPEDYFDEADADAEEPQGGAARFLFGLEPTRPARQAMLGDTQAGELPANAYDDEGFLTDRGRELMRSQQREAQGRSFDEEAREARAQGRVESPLDIEEQRRQEAIGPDIEGQQTLDEVEVDPTEEVAELEAEREVVETPENILDREPRAEDVPYKLAYAAHAGMSHVPDERAKQRQIYYLDDMKAFREHLEAQSSNPESVKDSVDAEFRRFREGYLKRLKALLSAESRTISPMITGPANFPVERNRKRMETAMRRSKELSDFISRARESAAKKVRQARDASEVTAEDDLWWDKHADQIIGDLFNIQNGRSRGSDPALFKANFYNRVLTLAKTGDARQVKRVLERVRRLQTDKEIKRGFTPRHRLWTLEAVAAHFAPSNQEPGETVSYELSDDLTVEWDGEAERVRLLFADKPDSETRSWLKGRGFRWSPKNQAWQRKTTANTVAVVAQKFDPDAETAMREKFGISPRKAEAEDVAPFAGRSRVDKQKPAYAPSSSDAYAGRTGRAVPGATKLKFFDGKTRVDPDGERPVFGKPPEFVEPAAVNINASKPKRAKPQIEVDPLKPTGKVQNIPAQIAKIHFEQGIPLRYGRTGRGVLGTYDPRGKNVLVRYRGDIVTAAHELGHALDDAYGLVAEYHDPNYGLTGVDPDYEDTSTSPFDDELIPDFAIYGSWQPQSKTVRGSQTYAREEGVAEWIRAYILNPEAAKKQAPKFAAHFAEKVPADVVGQIDKFGRAMRENAGAGAIQQLAAHTQVFDPTRGPEALIRTMFDTKGRLWRPGKWDKFNAAITDSLAPVWSAVDYSLKVQGIDELLPENDPRIRIRGFMGGFNRKAAQVTEDGMIDGNGNRVTEGGLLWLLEPVTVNDEDRRAGRSQEDLLAETQAVMTAQRIVAKHELEKERANEERAGFVGRTIPIVEEAISVLEEFNGDERRATKRIAEARANLERWRDKDVDPKDPLGIGEDQRIKDRVQKFADDRYERRVAVSRGSLANSIGATGGMRNELDVSYDALKQFAKQPEPLRARVLEAARRYREWGDRAFDYLVDSGRLSREDADKIRTENPDWVSMFRVEDPNNKNVEYASGMRKILSSKQPKALRKWKGSRRVLENAWVSLMMSTVDMMEEADRNRARLTLFDVFNGNRQMHDRDGRSPLGHLIVKAPAKDSDTITTYRDGKETHWAIEDDTLRKSLTDWDAYSGNNFADDALGAMARVIHTSVVHTPSFLTRNFIRDPFHRVIVSRAKSKMSSQLYAVVDRKSSIVDLEEMIANGGGFFGFWAGGRKEYDKRLRRMVHEHDNANTVYSTLGRLGEFAAKPVEFYTRAAQNSELLGRLAEYRDAKKYATETLGYDDVNAKLWAAYQARDVVDYAIAGNWFRAIRRYIPFANAAVQGLRRSVIAAKENPSASAGRWLAYVAAPTMAIYALNMALGDDEERQQMPGYLKDFFWNVKIGPDLWLRIPKPFEYGVLATGIERSLDQARGHTGAWDDYSASVARGFLPLDQTAVFLSFEPLVEAFFANRNFYTGNPIVPWYEENLYLPLREGADRASRVGRFIQDTIGIDGRRIDHIIRGYTADFGRVALEASDTGRTDRPEAWRVAVRSSGLLVGSPAWQATDVKYVLNWAERFGKRDIAEPIIELGKQYARSKDARERDAVAEQMRTLASQMRPFLQESGEVLETNARQQRDMRRELSDILGR